MVVKTMDEKELAELDKQLAEAKNAVPMPKQPDIVGAVIEQNARKTDDVKATIDLLSTKEALKRDGTVDTLVSEKTEELKNDAMAKRVEAETAKIAKEVQKVKQESEREIAELAKQKNRLQAEVEQMAKEADKAEAYYEANKDILKCAGITTKKTMSVMKFWLYPASLIFILIQIIKLPITICGALLSGVIDIVGDVCNSIKNNAIKIIVAIVVILLLAAAVAGTIFGGQSLIKYIGTKTSGGTLLCL